MDIIGNTLAELNVWSTAFRVFLAVLLGGLIGLERGHHGRAAGLRTHILVCLGAAMAALVGLYTVSVLGFSSDPMRVGAQVISGIGFLGVGTIIIRNRQQVTGLTTAAGLWTTACIGLAVGIGYYVAALVAFLAVMITMAIFVYLERSVKSKVTYSCYVELTDVTRVNALYDSVKSLVSQAELIPAKSGIVPHVGMELNADSKSHYEQLLLLIDQNDDIVVALPIQN
ncbi:MAG: MgtC/SapB family protein [Clostridia bacterium]|nr:MgtC/SapB family protein [Clostridia bacterium]